MKTIPVYTRSVTILADLHSPTGIYSRIRTHFPETLLLESNEYQSSGSGRSIICIEPIAFFEAKHGVVRSSISLDHKLAIKEKLQTFLQSFQVAGESLEGQKSNGFFGYTSYCAVQHFEDIQFKKEKYQSTSPTADIPEILYMLFRNVIVIDHRNHTLKITANTLSADAQSEESISKILSIIRDPLPKPYSFSCTDAETASITDEVFLSNVKKLQEHIQRGDIFQVVPSRRFYQKFRGDDFQVYRALRSINPSPYLYYFDLGHFRLFGSSPETALIVENQKAILNPIAGTARRTGDEAVDKETLGRLMVDPKEQSEHVMLVDLARNDLSRSCFPVSVDEFKKIHSYSHVTHLVSSVIGVVPKETSAVEIFFDVLPAGTVSGAPKYRAMELIDSLEPEARSFYAGAIGFFGFDGSCIHALTIRSFLSKDNTLMYQAGAGIVADSQPIKELEEIHSKLGALRLAIKKGESLHE